MSDFQAELIGTLILILLGDGVVANVVLDESKGKDSDWIVVAAGWGMAVAVAVYAVMRFTGGHINPAVTLGAAITGGLEWSRVPAFVGGQMVGAFLGAVLVWLTYMGQFAATEDRAGKLGVFCTAPAIRNLPQNLLTEFLATTMLVVGASAILANDLTPGLGALLVGLLVFSLGLSLGGPTGYAINPARDLGPRIAHALLPIPDKGPSDWGYAWVPVVGPLLGGAAGALLYQALWAGA